MAEALTAVRESSGFTGSRRSHARAGEWRAGPARVTPRAVILRIVLPAVVAAAALYAAFALGVPRKVGALLGLGPSPGEGLRITVFPPAVVAGSPEDQILADGLAEYLRRSLDLIARRTRSWVTPVEHQEGYDVPEAADALQALGTNRVVSGTLKRSSDSLNLTIEIVDPARLTRLGSFPKSDNISNIATWQEDLVVETASALGLVTTPAVRSALAAAGTTVPRAFHAYLHGLGNLSVLYGLSHSNGFEDTSRRIWRLGKPTRRMRTTNRSEFLAASW